MAHLLAVANQKGGVGKTTTTINLGAALAQAGRRVLLIDLDPQASLTAAVGIDETTLTHSLYNVLTGEAELGDVLLTAHGLTVAPASIDLAAAELQLISEVGRERVLAEALVDHLDAFDDILIDCPPSLGILTLNALSAADEVLIPVQCHFLALRGLAMLFTSIEKIRRRSNPRLKIRGILPTMYDSRNAHEREVVADLTARYGNLVFPPVKRSTRFADSTLAGQPMLDFDARHAGSQVYRDLAAEVLRVV